MRWLCWWWRDCGDAIESALREQRWWDLVSNPELRGAMLTEALALLIHDLVSET